MQAIGIVAEYNPFHKGHLLHLQAAKKYCDLPVITVMSGSLMQRGEPAFADKWLRAQIAVANGVDLVLELPTAFTLRSAEFFAAGGVKLLKATGIVTHLACGAENAELNYTELAKKILTHSVQEHIKEQLQKGLPYAKACELVLGNSAALVSKPNNILALEYAKALLATDIHLLVIARQGCSYNDTSLTELASATAIRQSFRKHQSWQQAVPAKTTLLLQQHLQALDYNSELLWQLLKYTLTLNSSAAIAAKSQCSEGLENLLQAAVTASSFSEAVAKCTNKRYPASRIRRLFLQLLLNKPRSYYEQEAPAYLRVLAFNDTGRQLLNAMKKTAQLPILTKLGKNPTLGQTPAFTQQLELDIAATDFVGLLRTPSQQPARDFLTSPYYQKTTL